LLGCLDGAQLGPLTIELAMDLVGADDGALLLPSSEGGLALACTRTTAAVPTFDSSPLAHALAARVASWHRPELIPGGLGHDPRFDGLEGRDLIQSSIIHPLILGGQRVGTIVVHRLARPGAFGRSDLHRLGVLAGQAALALENSRIHEDLRRRLAEIEKWGRQALQTDKLAAVGMMAAGVAHEINNPLGFVMTNLQTLREELQASHPDLGDLAADALHGAQRIRVIARDLRAFSRTDEQGVDAVDVNEAVTASLNIAHNQIKYRATLVKDLAPDLPPINGNPGRLGQVFLNLVVNAAQALEPDRADDNRVTVRTRRNGDTIEVQVVDTGCGIAEEHLARIFTPFFTTKARDIGTGLGLSICQDIVRQHRGSIRCESRLGTGTTFTVSLPLDTGRKRTVTPIFMPAVTVTRRGRVMIIDDEPMLAHAYRRMLAKEHEVVVCSSGREAVALLEQDSSFDAVFCDVMMPGMSGVAVYRALGQSRPAMTARFVFMTGGAFTAESRSFLDSIENPRLDKPIDVDSFRRAIADRMGTSARPVSD
jgi:signal transduction histidine kinase/CheY-like chemotaxis protein